MSIGKIIAIAGLVFSGVLILLIAVHVLPSLAAWIVLALIAFAFAAVLFG